MGRSGSVSVALIAIVLVISILPGCGSGSGTTPFPTPAQVTIIPSNAVSLTLGETLSFAATTMFNGRPVTQPVQFHSTNTAVVTVANNGQACAGSWNSLTTPQVCTPGSAGIAQVTANAMGVSSTAVTIYVHQPIDNLTIAPIPPAPPTACLSKETTANYQVTAFARGVDITATVGQFTWQSAQTAVAGVSSTVSSLGNRINGVSLNQVQITAKTPGLTQLFASVGNTISAPFNLYTCPVKSVALEINGISQFLHRGRFGIENRHSYGHRRQQHPYHRDTAHLEFFVAKRGHGLGQQHDGYRNHHPLSSRNHGRCRLLHSPDLQHRADPCGSSLSHRRDLCPERDYRNSHAQRRH